MIGPSRASRPAPGRRTSAPIPEPRGVLQQLQQLKLARRRNRSYLSTCSPSSRSTSSPPRSSTPPQLSTATRVASGPDNPSTSSCRSTVDVARAPTHVEHSQHSAVRDPAVVCVPRRRCDWLRYQPRRRAVDTQPRPGLLQRVLLPPPCPFLRMRKHHFCRRRAVGPPDRLAPARAEDPAYHLCRGHFPIISSHHRLHARGATWGSPRRRRVANSSDRGCVRPNYPLARGRAPPPTASGPH